ncbi:MAG: FKBP-type peptidyl-prolyl cis-trans isomerase [Bacteroidetes bacterium]|nr:FKBP-type peptidyl-prolyl cis-trans isomerase [Bacteroidota bacterium]
MANMFPCIIKEFWMMEPFLMTSYTRGTPLDFTIGSGKVIPGIESAARKLRLGTKAIVTIPPALGYGDGKDANGKDVKLPPKIPANARLTFHIDLVGSF